MSGKTMDRAEYEREQIRNCIEHLSLMKVLEDVAFYSFASFFRFGEK